MSDLIRRVFSNPQHKGPGINDKASVWLGGTVAFHKSGDTRNRVTRNLEPKEENMSYFCFRNIVTMGIYTSVYILHVIAIFVPLPPY
jgi:hypothetical protein